jgi:hypothetical protein
MEYNNIINDTSTRVTGIAYKYTSGSSLSRSTNSANIANMKNVQDVMRKSSFIEPNKYKNRDNRMSKINTIIDVGFCTISTNLENPYMLLYIINEFVISLYKSYNNLNPAKIVVTNKNAMMRPSIFDLNKL